MNQEDNQLALTGLNRQERLFSGIVDPEQWTRIQNLFSKIIGLNVSFLSHEGQPVVDASVVSPLFSEICRRSDVAESHDFILEAIQQGTVDKKTQLSRFGLHFFLLALNLNQQRFGYFVIGPVLIGHRETPENYRALCRENGLDEEIYLDHIPELKIYSHLAISAILDFLHEMAECFLERNVLRQEVEEVVPQFMHMKGRDGLLSLRYCHELSESLLDISLGLVAGDSGSVLLLDSAQECFQIQAARGLHQQYLQETKIPWRSGVAGLVAQRGKAMLLHQEINDSHFLERFKKPQVKSSIVIPIMHREQLLGVFCLNALSENPKFNQENLFHLDQLGKVAGIAFARLNED